MTENNQLQKETLCQELRNLFNLTPSQLDVFISVIVKCMIHNLIINNIDGQKNYSQPLEMELPDIGKIIFSFDKGKIKDTKIELEDEFKSIVEKSIVSLESPLIDELTETMAKRIALKYKSVI